MIKDAPRPAASAGYCIYQSIPLQARDTEFVELHDRPQVRLIDALRSAPVVRLSLRVDLSMFFWDVVAHTQQLLAGRRLMVIAGLKAPLASRYFYNGVRV
jgi:hypothetical protein